MKLLLATLCVALSVSITTAQPLRLNEVMSSNSGALSDIDGDNPDWIELFNAGSTAINLNGYGLSDKKTQPFQWTFPNFQLNPGEYLLIYASGKDRREAPGYWNTLISKGDDWKYIVPTEEPATNWRFFEFADNAWLTGKSGFGFGDDDDNTKLQNATCVFLRKKFTITNPADVTQLILHMDFDDGFVAYLNGKEIARVNMVGRGEFPAFNALASEQHEALIYQGLTPEKFVVSNPANFLKSGENILAIQVHNVFSTSSDFSAIPFLSVSTSSPPVSPRIIATLNLTSAQLHANFKVDADGESIYLTTPTGELADSVRVVAIPVNNSLGRALNNPSSWMIFPSSTPGKVNSGSDFPAEKPGIPVFNNPGAVYSNGIKIKLTAPSLKDTIYYTLDGSEPTRFSFIYSGEININSTKVVRARILKSGMLPGLIITHSYIVGNSKTIPVVSISMSPADLWDYNTGIYVKGPNAEANIPFFGANFWMDWEKACHLELFEPPGTKAVDVDAGTKIFGNWSRAHDQKSMAFYCRKSYGYESMQHKIFPDWPYTEFKDIVLRNSGNDWNITMFRDGLMTGLTKGLNLDCQAFRPAAIYLNGEYWGILNIREKVNEHMLALHHDLDADEISILENNGNVVVGNSSDYWAMMSFIETNSLTVQANYDKVMQWIDVNSFIDYYAAQIYFRNHDWPGNNIKYWRSDEWDGRWRWILYDTDFGMGIWNSSPSENTLELATATNGPSWPNPPWSTLLFRKLLENTTFRNQFTNRFADLLNSSFLADRVIRAIDQKQNTIAQEIGAHLQRWNGISVTAWQNNVQVMRNFASNRPANVFNHLRQKFAFQYPQTITARADSTQGNIQLNSLKLSNFPWKGIYFPDVPVTLTAVPLAGFRFVKWTGITSGTTSATITIVPQANVDVTAIFENDGSHYEDIIINEISYNNAANRNPGDWIELFNKGKYDIDISGWKLTDTNPEHQFIFAANTLLKAGEYLVVANDLAKMKTIFGSFKNLLEPFAFNFGLSDQSDAVKLYSRENQLIDEVIYSNSEPWQTFDRAELWSLELIDPTRNNNSGRNWVLSAVDGTPGIRNTPMIPDNTEELTPGAQPAMSTCFPNPFTDGTYILFTPKRMGNYQISIHDVNGKKMRILNESIAIEEQKSVFWDGRDQNGNLATPGLYFYSIETEGYRQVGKMVKLKDK